MSYATGLKDGAHVPAGQMIGYVGDSGDANGDRVAPALRGASRTAAPPCRPYPYLQSAQQLLFFAKVGTPFTLALTGTVVAATDTTLTLQASRRCRRSR